MNLRRRQPNVLVIGSELQPVSQVHRELSRYKGVVVCSRLLDHSAYTIEEREYLESVKEIDRLDDGLTQVFKGLGHVARVGLVVNLASDGDGPEGPQIGGINSAERQQVTDLLALTREVFFINEVPPMSVKHDYDLTPRRGFLLNDRVIGGHLETVAAHI